MKNKIKKDDTVVVISGKCKSKEGKVLDVDYKSNCIKVDNVALRTHFVKKTEKNEGGLIKSPGFIDLSNVKLVKTITKKQR